MADLDTLRDLYDAQFHADSPNSPYFEPSVCAHGCEDECEECADEEAERERINKIMQTPWDVLRRGAGK